MLGNASVLPNRVPLSTGRGFPGLDSLQQQAAQAGLDPNASLDDLQGFVNNGGLAQALQSNPAGAALLSRMLQGVAQNASRDQAQLDQLGQSTGLGATAQSFDPLSGNALQNGIGAIGSDGSGADQQLADLGQLGGGGGFFEDKVFSIMCKVVEQYQKQIEQRLQNLQDQAQAAQSSSQSGGQDSGSESRNIEFEKIKYDMQKLSQMQQAMSNVLDSMNDLAQNAIRKIKGTG